MPLLTIAIPTYDRLPQLRAHLPSLAAQWTPDVELLIVDNTSPSPVEPLAQELLQTLPPAGWRVVRNRANIGMNANFLRCFELCQTEWLWIVSDDEQLRPDAVATVLRTLTSCPPETVFAQFGDRSTARVARGQDELLLGLENLQNVFLISTGVYRVAPMLGQLRIGYLYNYSFVSFFAVLLAALGETGLAWLAPESLVADWKPAPVEHQWSIITGGLGVMTILELPLNPATRRDFATKKSRGFPRLESYALQLVLAAQRARDASTALYLYDQLCFRLYYFDHSPLRRARIMFWRWLVRFPQLGYALFRFAYRRLRGKDIDAMRQHRFERN